MTSKNRLDLMLSNHYHHNRWHQHTKFQFAPKWMTPWKYMKCWNHDHLTRFAKT